MNEEALRVLVREAVARHLPPDTQPVLGHSLPLTAHPSHHRYALPKTDGPCLIEPGVQCNHCGYCESHGH